MKRVGEWPSTRLTLLNRLLNPEDNQSWKEFWDIYSELIYRFCRKRLLRHEDAIDVRQSAMLALQRGLKTFDPEIGRFRGWFGKLILCEIYKQRSKYPEIPQLQDDLSDKKSESDDAMWDREFATHIVGIAISRIQAEFTPLEWGVFSKVVLEGRKPAEVAAELACDPAWLYRAKYRVLKRLQAETAYLSNESDCLGGNFI